MAFFHKIKKKESSDVSESSLNSATEKSSDVKPSSNSTTEASPSSGSPQDSSSKPTEASLPSSDSSAKSATPLSSSDTKPAQSEQPSSTMTSSSKSTMTSDPESLGKKTIEKPSSEQGSTDTQSSKSQDNAELQKINIPNVEAFGSKKTEPTELDLGQTENLLKQLKEGESIKTNYDAIIEVIKNKGGKAKLYDMYAHTDLKKKTIDYLLRILSKEKIVEIYYPTNPLASPVVTLKKENLTKLEVIDQEINPDKKLIETYAVISDFVVADVKIWSVPFENTPIYEVVPHELSLGTKALILDLVEDMARKLAVKFEDISDPRKLLELKKTFYEAAKKSIKEAIPDIDDDYLKVLAGTLLHHSYGLGDMEIIMSDNWLEEIAINGAKEPISVYHRKYGWLKTTKKFNSEADIYNFSSQIGRKVGKQITSLSPIMDAHLLTGDRVAATLFPISTEGGTLTIRRFARNPWTVVHMIDPKNPTMSKEMMSLLWLSIQYELNVLVVGGTASGKTSVLNTLCSLIPPTNRIISIEDTREISLPDALHWNWVPLASRTKNAEGLGEVTMLDLMVASLRMRPDRIVVGEIRRKEQAEAMFEAMHTGHSVSATMHADTTEQIKRRLTQPPIEIPENEAQALQLVLVQYRDRRRGIRRTLEISEFLPGSQDEKININYLYRWRPRSDKFERDSSSIRISEDLNLHTGMTTQDIENDLAEKQDILQWMLDNNIKDVNRVGQIMRIYYKYPKMLLDTVTDRQSPENLTYGQRDS